MKANHICGPESSCDMECVQQAVYDELVTAARDACSEMGCYCESDPPERTCVMCRLGALVSSQSDAAAEPTSHSGEGK
jgi:hypothetical protein